MAIRLSLSFCLFCLVACSSPYEQLAPEAVDQEEARLAEGLAMRILNGCETGSFVQLTTSEATLTMVEGMTAEMQQQACDFLAENYGQLSRLELGEVLQSVKTAEYRIYRFKANFQETKAQAEVRITLNKEDKLSGVWTMPWKGG